MSLESTPSAPKNLWQQFIAHRRVVQFVEYMVGGGVYFFCGMGVFAFLYSGLKINWLTSKIIADITGWTLGFIIQRYWAFNDKRLEHHNVKIGMRYLLITVLNFAIDYGIVAMLNHFGISPYLGMITSAQFFTAWNYLWYRFWVFNPKRAASAR